MRTNAIFALCLMLVGPTFADERKPPVNPFFAMDTAFRREDTKFSIQLAAVRDLGYVGVSINEEPVEQLRALQARADEAKLTVFAIYCAASVTADGTLTLAPDLHDAMKLFKGRGTVFWLHIGGTGPAFDALKPDAPVIVALRKLADEAAADGVKVAIYPHFGEWTAHFGDACKVAQAVHHQSFGVTFNLCHALATGDESHIRELINHAGPLIFCVTINGADAGVSGPQWDKLIQPLGKGTFDTQTVLQALAESHYDGPIGFQGFGIKGDAPSILKPTIAAWKQLVARASCPCLIVTMI